MKNTDNIAKSLCFCFMDTCKKCNSPEFQEQQKATRERRLAIPEYRREAGPAKV